LLTTGVADGDARAELLKLAVRKIIEETLEAEVNDALGRGYYENGAEPGRGYRNGYRRGRLRTAEGPIEYGVPQVAARAEPFVWRVRAGVAGRTAELEQLAVEMYARGLRARDIEAAFRDATGASVLSRTAVSEVTARLWQEYEAFAGRDLSEFVIAYLFIDGVAERWTPASRARSGRRWCSASSTDFEACIAHLRFPLRHRRAIRTTTLLERLFLEERRRTKIIPHAFGERAVLKLMFAAVIRAAERWRGIQVGESEQRQLRAIRDEPNRAHAQRVAPAVSRPTSPVVQKLRK
jgi:transposase-like protein